MENKKLNEFLEICKVDKDINEIKYYANSVLIYFNEAIYSHLTEKLKTLPNNYFISLSKSIIDDQYNIILFIYKIKTFENEK